jgi:hypothetical protein
LVEFIPFPTTDVERLENKLSNLSVTQQKEFKKNKQEVSQATGKKS